MKRKKSTMFFTNDELFHKQYEFQLDSVWQLSQNVFKHHHWQIPSLQAKKCKLNATKERLNSFNLAEWSLHTKKRDPSTQIIKTIRKRYDPELLTQAWCIFYECLSRYDLIHPEAVKLGELTSLHLCEAPGGFISALNHFLKTKYLNMNFNWYASTLNPNYEGNPTDQMIPDDRLIIHTQDNWLFGADNTDNTLKYYNYKWIVRTIEEKCPHKVHLVTSDGSIDCMKDPGNQVMNVEHLQYCEVTTALSVLASGGNFVLKIFTTFEDSTISLLYLLNCVFHNVSIIKPITSKRGNSETYVICQNFKSFEKLSNIWCKILQNYEIPNNNKSLFSLEDIPEDFLAQVEECSEYFMCHQINTIQENINHFSRDSKEYIEYKNYMLYKHHLHFVNKSLALYTIFPIQTDQQLVNQKMKFSKMYTPQMSIKSRSFLFYKTENRDIKLHFVFGKKVEKIVYSKFASGEVQFVKKLNVSNQRSLFSLCITNLSYCKIFDSYINHQFNINSLFLSNLLENVQEKNFINLNLSSNFIVGLIFIQSQAYTIYFFKYGLIYLVPNRDNECLLRDKDTLKKIIDVKIPKPIDFDNDLIQLVDFREFDSRFIDCVRFYNSYLC